MRVKGGSGLESSTPELPQPVFYPLGQMVSQHHCLGMKLFQTGEFFPESLLQTWQDCRGLRLFLKPTFRHAHLGKHDCERNSLPATFSSSQATNCFCFSGLQEDALKPAPTRNQVVTKPEPPPSITKSASLPGLQVGPALVPHRPPPKVPTTKKPVPLQRTGVKAENVR